MGSVRRVGALFDEVTADTAAHMESLNMVSQSMADLGSITQQNAALAEKTDSAAAELQSLATHLAGVLQAFKLPSGSRPAQVPVIATAATLGRPVPAAGTRAKAQSIAPVGAAAVTYF